MNPGGDALCLQDLAASDPEAMHGGIRDNPGFPLRDGDARLPARVRIVPLPPCSPELNPCEQAWEVIKDEVSNHSCPNTDKLRDALLPTLKRFGESAHTVLSLIARPWLRDQSNAT